MFFEVLLIFFEMFWLIVRLISSLKIESIVCIMRALGGCFFIVSWISPSNDVRWKTSIYFCTKFTVFTVAAIIFPSKNAVRQIATQKTHSNYANTNGYEMLDMGILADISGSHYMLASSFFHMYDSCLWTLRNMTIWLILFNWYDIHS